MNILGINAFGHDSSAALLSDGELVAAVQEERFSRVKHDGAFPAQAIRFCLRRGGLKPSEIDRVAFYHNPYRHTCRRLFHSLGSLPRSLLFFSRQRSAVGDWGRMFAIRAFLGRCFGKEMSRCTVHYLDHHLTHAASAFYLSPFEEAAVLSVDGMGEWATTFLGVGRGNRIRKLEEIYFPDSLGIFYETLTQYLGFRKHHDECKVMSMAAYGQPIFEREFNRMIRPNPSNEDLFCLDRRYFGFWYGDSRFYTDDMIDMLGPPRRPGEEFVERHYQVAATLQKVLTDRLLGLMKWLRARTGLRDLVIAGGVGLNCMANGEILRSALFDRIFVQPAAYDAGCSVGSALLVYHLIEDNARLEPLGNVYWGPEYTASDIQSVIRRAGYGESELDDPAREAAGRLAEGQILGWYQGRLEFGPRALGHRSILADPRDNGVKEKLNLRVKHREHFRPFAPSVLEAYASRYYREVIRSPFMLFNFETYPHVRDRIPGVIHVDGSSRLQTVSEEDDPLYYRLISSFMERTGVPMVLNTSFNTGAEPIVCSPEDAIRNFEACGLDALIMDRFLIEKPGRSHPTEEVA